MTLQVSSGYHDSSIKLRGQEGNLLTQPKRNGTDSPTDDGPNQLNNTTPGLSPSQARSSGPGPPGYGLSVLVRCRPGARLLAQLTTVTQLTGKFLWRVTRGRLPSDQ